MKQLSEIAVLIQARLSSQRCPRKMIRPFAGTTLTDISIRKILDSSVIPKENFYLAVHEPELIEIAEKYDVNVFKRSEKSANSEGTPLTDMYEWWNKIPFKYAVLVNACAPLLTTETIDNFVVEYTKGPDGLFGVMEKKNYFWNTDNVLITNWPQDQACMNTKFVETTYEAAHCLYAGRLDKIGDGIWMGDFNKPGDISLFPMHEKECLDIDYEWQFDMYETMFKNRKK